MNKYIVKKNCTFRFPLPRECMESSSRLEALFQDLLDKGKKDSVKLNMFEKNLNFK